MKKEINKKHIATIAFYIILVSIITLGYVIKYYNSKDDITMEDIMVEDDSIWLPEPSGSTPTPTPCPAGTTGTAGGTCTTCAAGTAGPGGTAACSACGGGKWSSAGSSSCSDIDAGCYGSSAGSSCPNKCAKGTYSEGGASSCSNCEEGTYSDVTGATSCKKCKLVSAYASGGEKVISPGTNWCLEVTYNNADCSGASYSPASCTAPTNVCGTSTISASINGTTKSASVKVAGDWKELGTVYYDKPLDASTRQEADGGYSGEAQMEYGQCYDISDELDGPKWECENVHVRGTCGRKITQTYDFCCVDNEYIGTSDNVIWAVKKYKKNDCAYYYGSEYSYVDVPREKCVKPKDIPDRCASTTAASIPKEETTNSCEEDYVVTFDEGEKCSKDSDYTSTFYTINCDRKLSTNFDYADDGDSNTLRELYVGQGFKFAITVKTAIHCLGVFDGDRWKNVYNLFIAKIKAVDEKLVDFVEDYDPDGWVDYIDNTLKPTKKKAKNDLYELWNVIKELKEIVDSYNKYVPTLDYDEQATLDFTYDVKGKKENSNTTFTQEVVSEGVYKTLYENEVELNVKSLTNPKNYEKSSADNPRTVRLSPPNAYINLKDAKVQDTDKDAVDGGEKIYVDYDSDVQEVKPITIKVTGLAGNKSIIQNNKCTVNIKGTEYKYRQIDVSNPFINSDWKKGENWINDNYNFISVIHATTWSEAAQKTIELDKDAIQEIKRSTDYYQANNDYPYLGICYRLESSSYDSITERLCSLIK